MTFDPRTVGPRIRVLLPELTTSEARITEILLRSDAAAEMPQKADAEEAETSEAMVVKRAQRARLQRLQGAARGADRLQEPT